MTRLKLFERVEYDISSIPAANVEPFLKESLAPALKESIANWSGEFCVDLNLVFAPDEFDKNKLIQHKGLYGRLQSIAGTIHIPSSSYLAVYDSFERKKPRGLVFIPKIVVCTIDDLLKEELQSEKQFLPGHSVLCSSIVSFYSFGDYKRT